MAGEIDQILHVTSEAIIDENKTASRAESDVQAASSPSNAAIKKVVYCHTPFREIGNEASIRVPRMFKSHAWQQYDKQMQCY
jgi:hypothetical protein